MPNELDRLALDRMVRALHGPPLPRPDPRKAVPMPQQDPRGWADRLPRVQASQDPGDAAFEKMPPNLNPQFGVPGAGIAPDYRIWKDPSDILPSPLNQVPQSAVPVDKIIKYLQLSGQNI